VADIPEADIPEPTFLEYLNRFRKRFSADTASWARDNIFWGIFVFLAPLIGLYLWQHTAIDWGLVYTTMLIYLVVFFLYLCVHAVRTPWKLDVDRATAIQQIIIDLKISQEALSNRSPNFLITTQKLWVTDARAFGVGNGHGVAALLEVHIVNISPSPGNVRALSVSVDLAGRKLPGIPIGPIYFEIQWRSEKMPAGEPIRPTICIHTQDFLFDLINGEVLTHNNGIKKWLIVFVDASKADVESSIITLLVTDATGKEFRAVSNPDSPRQFEEGYRR
jgi:hypothetical protein